MSRIRSRDTKPELAVRSYLHQHGFRYRLHDPSLPGKPDLVLKARKIAIFVHGCFWHGHSNCTRRLTPQTRREYWVPKIAMNKRRDLRAARRLRKLGWRVLVVWECRINQSRLEKLVRDITSRDS
jgi:DNA mismatch endonuclease, patch repair protein